MIFTCPICGGRLLLLKSITKSFGVDPKTGAIAQRPREQSIESIWMRCENGCPEGPFYDDLPDGIKNAAEAVELSSQTQEGD